MKRKHIIPLGLLLTAMPLSAQDIYKMEMFSSSDLNGTARFVGMGGAMNALGADISTIGTNPAAIGVFRKSDISLTGSLLAQPDAKEFYDVNKARTSFDQIGFVYAAKMGGGLKFVNFGFNYHKSRNMKHFIGIDNFSTNGLSQSLQMLDLSYVDGGVLDLNNDKDREYTTPLTNLGYDTQMLAPIYDEEGKLTGYAPCEADTYNYRRAQWGGIQDYDFNLSLNWEDMVYAGMTFGVKNVDINSATYYGEMLPDETGHQHAYHMLNEESLTGTGYDFKLGLIVRPIEESPFRIGLAVHSPTFYDLKSDAYLRMSSPFKNGDEDRTNASAEIGGNEYKIRTPWKFNVSMGTVIENLLALDIEYEYSHYGKSKVSYFDDYYDSPFSFGENDHALNREAERFLKPVSSFRFGAEGRITPNFYARAGYNYVSAPMKEEAFLNLFTNSSSYYYSTNTDYVNLGETQRATCGLGYKSKHFYADVAYQYQKQGADVYTFHLPDGEHSEKNRLQGAKMDLVRHNVMLTLGYRF